jgi:hypothetical protein
MSLRALGVGRHGNQPAAGAGFLRAFRAADTALSESESCGASDPLVSGIATQNNSKACSAPASSS